MLIANESFVGPDLGKIIPEEYGHHDVTWIRRETDGSIIPEARSSQALTSFLGGITSLLAELEQVDDPFVDDLGVGHDELVEYTYGTAFLNVVPARDLGSGAFHYDTGFDRSIKDSNVGSPVLRFAGNWSGDGVNISYVFSDDHGHYGRLVDDVREDGAEGLIQPPNDKVVVYNEGTSLHGRSSAPARPGETNVIWSATLYKQYQVPTIIPVTAVLDLPDVYMWRQCG
jgi:hypothetical protein